MHATTHRPVAVCGVILWLFAIACAGHAQETTEMAERGMQELGSIASGVVDSGSLEEKFDAEADASLPRDWRHQLRVGDNGASSADFVLASANGGVFHRPNCPCLERMTQLKAYPGPVAALVAKLKPCPQCLPELASACSGIGIDHHLRLSDNRVRRAYQGCLRELSRAVRYNVGAGINLERAFQRIAEGDEFGRQRAYKARRGASYEQIKELEAKQAASYALSIASTNQAISLKQTANRARGDFGEAFQEWVRISEEENARLWSIINARLNQPM